MNFFPITNVNPCIALNSVYQSTMIIPILKTGDGKDWRPMKSRPIEWMHLVNQNLNRIEIVHFVFTLQSSIKCRSWVQVLKSFTSMPSFWLAWCRKFSLKHLFYFALMHRTKITKKERIFFFEWVDAQLRLHNFQFIILIVFDCCFYWIRTYRTKSILDEQTMVEMKILSKDTIRFELY